MENVISKYTLTQGIADGLLYPLGFAKGKPLVGTLGTVTDLPSEEHRQLFADFLRWQREVEPTLPEEERHFSATASNGQTVWVIEDGVAITLLYPSEY